MRQVLCSKSISEPIPANRLFPIKKMTNPMTSVDARSIIYEHTNRSSDDYHCYCLRLNQKMTNIKVHSILFFFVGWSSFQTERSCNIPQIQKLHKEHSAVNIFFKTINFPSLGIALREIFNQRMTTIFSIQVTELHSEL